VILHQLLEGDSLGPIIGGIIGAVAVGTAQIWSFRRGKQSARADQSVSAAADLLSTLYAAKDTLRLLPYTEAPAGSPLSHRERGDRARPMLDELRRAVFVTVPLLTDRELARRFRLFLTTCQFIASSSVDASEVHEAVKEADMYADHLGACLAAHIDETPIPAAPTLAITARAARQEQVIIPSMTKPGQIVTQKNEAA
jgi:hypothetical protein